MDWITPFSTSCPHCGEPIELVIDGSAAPQTYVEDCEVCCRPIVVSTSAQHSDDAGGICVSLRREND